MTPKLSTMDQSLMQESSSEFCTVSTLETGEIILNGFHHEPQKLDWMAACIHTKYDTPCESIHVFDVWSGQWLHSWERSQVN